MSVLVVDGKIVAQVKKPTPRQGGPDAVIAAIVRGIELIDPDGIATAIGLGVPGPVIPGTGVLPAAPNLPGWDHDVEIGGTLSGLLGNRPVVVDNDVNVGTLAEHRQGAGVGVDNLLGVFAGTGVGAGLILDGRLRQGPRGMAGEIGHTFVAFRDLDAECPGRGELEDYAGRNSLERRARHFVAGGEPSVILDLAGGGRVKSRIWSEAMALGDSLAGRLIDEAASAIAAAMASAIALVDIEVIVLGGGLAERLGESFRRKIETELTRRAFAGTSAPVRAARLGNTGGALGAALLVEESP